MFMPLTEAPGALNEGWGGDGIPASYPIAINGLGAWTDHVPSAHDIGSELRSMSPNRETIINVLLYAAGAYTLYQILKGTTRKVKSGARYISRYPGAIRKYREAGREAFSAHMKGE